MFFIYLLQLTLILGRTYAVKQPYFLSDEYIKKINSEQSTWQAGRNFGSDVTENEIKKLLGDLDPSELRSEFLPQVKLEDPEWPSIESIPASFDSRSRWRKMCPRISEIMDQGNCGSCWAVSSASAMTDRHCISSKGKHTARLSAHHLFTCCRMCGEGCNGGYTAVAWDFFKKRGLVSGGEYHSNEGCQPYGAERCMHANTTGPFRNCKDIDYKTPPCKTKCTNAVYKKPFKHDKRKNKDHYTMTNITAIQRDLIAHGPIAMSFKVFSDFLNYKSGVYVKTPGAKLLGGHAVKIIGWGKEKGVPYWLVMNSWNEYWGDKGLFKIRRGTNECNCETNLNAGIPRRYRKPTATQDSLLEQFEDDAEDEE